MHSPNLLRKWATLALVGCFVVSAAQEQPRVTLSKPVMKASMVLQEIAAQTGTYLASDPVVGNIPILISVTDADLSAVLEKIARATGGELKAENGGWRLVNNNQLRREQELKETQWIVQAFDRAKQRMASRAADTPDRWDDATLDKLVADAQAKQKAMQERINAIQAREGTQIQFFDSSMQSATPASNSARRALEVIPSSVFASIAPGDRVVFSSAANRMQRRMTFNINAIVNDFVTNHNMLARRSGELAPPNQNVNVIGALTAVQPLQGVAETHVILSRGYRSTTISLEIKFYDRNGLAVGQGSASITPEYPPVAQKPAEEGKTIELSEMSRQMAQLMAQETAAPTGQRDVMRIASVNGNSGAFVTLAGGDMGVPKQIPDELFNVLLNPDKYDPASLYVSEAYTQVAKAEGKNIVAAFPDRAVKDMARAFVSGNVSTKTVLSNSAAYGLDVEATDGWLLVTPTWADATRKTNFNREQAGKFYRAVNSRGFATLEELANYSFYLTLGLPDRPLDMAYLALLSKDTAGTLDEYVSFNLDLLRLYAVIPDNAKKSAGERIQIPFRSLNAQAREFAEHAYYAKPTGFIMPGMSGEMKFTAVMAFDNSEQRNGPPPNSILNEPTEALPNGIPGEALVTVMRSVRDGVFASTKGIRGGSLMSAEELGMRQSMLQANFRGGQAPPDYDTFLAAQIVNVEIALELAEYGRPSAMFKDGWTMSGARPLSYNQLSDEFRAQVEAFKQSFMSPPPLVEGGAIRRGGGGG